MGLIDKLRKAGGIVKNRLASAVGALKGVTIGGATTRRGIRVAARATRLTSPLGIGLTAVSFAPEIVRGVKAAGRFLQRSVPRGVAFVGGRRVVSGITGGAAAGAVAAGIESRKAGRPAPVQTLDPRSAAERNRDIEKAFKAGRPTPKRRKVNGRRTTKARKRKAPTRRTVKKRRVTRKRKRRTHRSPRHKGHKRVSFTTADGKKVSFLSNPKARHR